MPRTNLEPVIPSEGDALLAREADRLLGEAGRADTGFTVQIVDAARQSTTLALPAPAAALLRKLLKEMGAGRAVAIVPIDAEVSTGEAADLLNVSRPFVVGLIDKGELPARMVGAHRRIRLDDVQAYQRKSRVRARSALEEMTAISQELGLE